MTGGRQETPVSVPNTGQPAVFQPDRPARPRFKPNRRRSNARVSRM